MHRPTRLLLATRDHLTQRRRVHRSEEEPPDVGNALHPARRELPDREAELLQHRGRLPHSAADLRLHRRVVPLLHHAHADARERRGSERDRGAEGVLRIVSGERGKQQPYILRAPRHGPRHAQQPARVRDGRAVPRRRDAAGRGLQPGNPGKVRRDSDRPATVASHATGRAERSDGRRFPAARPASGTVLVPRIRGAAGHQVIGFVGGEELGRVRFAQDDRAGRAQSRHRGGVAVGAVADAEAAAGPGSAGPPCRSCPSLSAGRRGAGRACRRATPAPGSRALPPALLRRRCGQTRSTAGSGARSGAGAPPPTPRETPALPVPGRPSGRATNGSALLRLWRSG